MSDVYLYSITTASGTGDGHNVDGSFRVILNIDDPLKYLFLGMPLMLTSHNHRLGRGMRRQTRLHRECWTVPTPPPRLRFCPPE